MTDPVEVLVELARSAREEPLPEVLDAVAAAVRLASGFQDVTINIYRPAWDDYEALVVTGSEDAIQAMKGKTIATQALEQLLSKHSERLPGVYFLEGGETDWEALGTGTYSPDLPRREYPNAWQPDDGLVVLVRDSAGGPLGFLSMDEPVSGLRLSDDELRVVRAICLHAEQALETARSHERTLEQERMNAALLEVAPLMPQCSTEQELAALVCDTVIAHLGFEAVSVFVSDGGDSLRWCDGRGWAPEESAPERLAFAEVESLLSADAEQAGCWLIPARDLFPSLPSGFHSARNGRGPKGWHDGLLLAPARNRDGSLRTLLVLDDPVDNQLPSDQRRQVVRLLVEQISAAQKLIEQRAHLAELATHDPLTGLRNRRGLDVLLTEHAQVALLVCDLDRFKLVNDRYGHAVGDQVLQRFGDLLNELARSTDVAIRLGGEEFCMVLPHTDRAGALEAAERLRIALQGRMTDLVPEGVTVSIGVAASSDGVLDARELLALADQGMYAAKQAGRNRSAEAGDQ